MVQLFSNHGHVFNCISLEVLRNPLVRKSWLAHETVVYALTIPRNKLEYLARSLRFKSVPAESKAVA